MFKVTIMISGRVQGVFYRQSMKAEALSLGLCGWVRNLQDGNVEALVCGNRKDVEALISWCRTGPPYADVKQLDCHWQTFADEPVLKSFEVR